MHLTFSLHYDNSLPISKVKQILKRLTIKNESKNGSNNEKYNSVAGYYILLLKNAISCDEVVRRGDVPFKLVLDL